MYGLKGETDPSQFVKILSEVKVPVFVPKTGVKVATTDSEAKQMAEAVEDDIDAHMRSIQSQLPTPASLAGYRMKPIDFEKDDDTNFHVAFITACSNLRARNYKVKEVNRHQTKFIAGKIIPAIATTTALVTGLVCIELYKLIQKKPLEAFRNTYANLALPLVAMSEPMPPQRSKAELKEGEWKWSLWDRIDINIGDVPLGDFLEWFKDKYGLEITMLSHGSSMLYYDFGMGVKKKVKERLAMPVSKVAEMVGKGPIPEREKFLVLEACVQNEEGNEVEIPFLRFRFRK
jgi:ubiquitin-activating enzyme E1